MPTATSMPAVILDSQDGLSSVLFLLFLLLLARESDNVDREEINVGASHRRDAHDGDDDGEPTTTTTEATTWSARSTTATEATMEEAPLRGG